jgi:hypothetical protein
VEHLFFILSDATVETEARGRWELGPAGNLLKVAKNRNFTNNADLIGSWRNCRFTTVKDNWARRNCRIVRFLWGCECGQIMRTEESGQSSA